MTLIRKLVLITIILLSYHILTFSKTLPDSTTAKLYQLSDNKKIEYLTDLMWTLREKDSDLAIKYGLYAVRLSDSLGIIEHSARTYNFIGVIYLHYKYDTQKAIPFLHRGLEYALQTNDSTEIGYTYNNLGDVFYLTGNVPLALEYSERSLNYFEKLNDDRGRANSFINLGIVYRNEKEYDAALEYFFKAIKLREKIGTKIGIASAFLEVGRTYFAKEAYDSAMTYFQNSLELHQILDNKRYMAFSLNGIANVYYQTGKYQNALQNYNLALQLDLERNHNYGIVSNKLGIALVYSKISNRIKGERALNEAIEIAEKMGLPPKILEAYENSTKFYLNLNDYKAATENFNNFLFVYDSLLSRQQFETLSEIENRYQISQTLKRTNRELELKTNEERYLVIIIVLMTILVGVLVWRYRANKLMNEKLQTINQSKDKLFAIISHDLKNPFNALIGFVDLLKEENLSEEERREYIKNLDGVTHNTYKLLENLLNLSASRAGKLDFNPKIFSLSELVEWIIKSQSMLISNKKINIETDMSLEQIFADKHMIEIIIRNLLTNAIKFSKEEGTIIIKSVREEKNNIIIVTDNGIGMSKDIKEKLFTSDFIQSATGTQGERGTGIGLSLCHEFVRKHGGKIEVNSEPSKGSEFMIYLPAEQN